MKNMFFFWTGRVFLEITLFRRIFMVGWPYYNFIYSSNTRWNIWKSYCSNQINQTDQSTFWTLDHTIFLFGSPSIEWICFRSLGGWAYHFVRWSNKVPLEFELLVHIYVFSVQLIGFKKENKVSCWILLYKN